MLKYYCMYWIAPKCRLTLTDSVNISPSETAVGALTVAAESRQWVNPGKLRYILT